MAGLVSHIIDSSRVKYKGGAGVSKVQFYPDPYQTQPIVFPIYTVVYQIMVGKLIYLIINQIDIAYVVSSLSLCMLHELTTWMCLGMENGSGLVQVKLNPNLPGIT